MSFFDNTSWKGVKPKTTLPKCGQCGLYRRCETPKMPVGGRGSIPILFVGEAPGESEDSSGKHFQGEGGKLLRELLEGLEFDLSDAWLTNAAICHPKGGIEDLHVISCRPNLINTINELKPKVVIPLGLVAVQSLIGDIKDLDDTDVGAIDTWVGWQIPSRKLNTWICPTYHPTHILRNNNDRALIKITRDQLRKALKLINRPLGGYDQKELESQVKVILDAQDMNDCLFELSQKEGDLAFDYETTGLKPDRPEHKIVSASFCFNHGETISGMIEPFHHKNLRAIMVNGNIRKSGWNIKFEDRWNRVKLGVETKGWYWDGMLGAHVLDNRSKITGLKFQALVRLGIADYSSHIKPYLTAEDANGFNRILEAPKRPLLLYGGLDSLLEDKIGVLQRQEFGYA